MNAPLNKPLIQLENISKRFGTLDVLKGLNLSIHQGEILVIIGKSGTGKSVLLKHIIGLVQPDSGRIYIQGELLEELPSAKIKTYQKLLSYMFQENALFDYMTIYDNIALPLIESRDVIPSRTREKVFILMERLGLRGIENKFPAQLSGGMRKRVALARALITDPKLVLFDEPTTGLDPIRKRKVHEMITEYKEHFGFTAVIVSHDIPNIYNIAQRIAMLKDGGILFEGSKEDVFKSHGKILNDFEKGKEI